MRFFYYVVGIALTWVLLFSFNNFAFSHFAHSAYANWIFLPAGVRLVAILLFDSIAILGLFVGSIITSDFTHLNLTNVIVISAISAINPFIALNISKYFLKINSQLINLQPSQLLILCSISALFNGLAHTIYLNFSNLENAVLANLITMMVGDFLGCLIILYVFSIGIKLTRKYVATNRDDHQND